ncbi:MULTISPECIES: DUF6883 domain-containing protein [Photorhabdus]|uniref:DUF6883 domain-containing protein n=1 Tax=Photorhabdus TaxID=29487 RepID=UPI002F412CF3
MLRLKAVKPIRCCADLISKIQAGAKTNKAILGNVDKFGQRIIIDMPITGPNGKTAIVRTGWIYDLGSSTSKALLKHRVH